MNYQFSVTVKNAISLYFFSRGAFYNLIDVLNFNCFGLLRPNKVDWTAIYDVPGKPENLLKIMQLNVSRENYQFV